MPDADTYRDETSLFELLRNKSKSVSIDGEEHWRVEGDLLLQVDELRDYARRRASLARAEAAVKANDLPLVAIVELSDISSGGKIVRWAPDVVLSYAVMRGSFRSGGDAGYELVVDCLRKAVSDWEQTCGVKFGYDGRLDNSDDAQDRVTFVVREVDGKGAFIASAFFPTSPPRRRRVLVDPSFYAEGLSFDRVGVFRHELGHVLGFRHEHIRTGKPPGCPDEDTYGTIALGDYEPKSVMHYFCGGVGSRDLVIAESDKAWAQSIYGKPLASFHLVR